MKIAIIGIVIILLAACGVFLFKQQHSRAQVSSYAECVAAGYPILETDPPMCKTPDGHTFVGIMQNATPTLLPETPTVMISPEDQQSEANIIVTSPSKQQSISGNTITIRGKARVFENVLNYRVTNENGVLVEKGNLTANSPDVGQYGIFEKTVTLKKGYIGGITVEVFSYSAKDGSEINLVTIPVTVMP